MKTIVLRTLWIMFWPFIETMNLIDDWMNGGIGAEEYAAKTALLWFYRIVFWPVIMVLEWATDWPIPIQRYREVNGKEERG